MHHQHGQWPQGSGAHERQLGLLGLCSHGSMSFIDNANLFNTFKYNQSHSKLLSL